MREHSEQNKPKEVARGFANFTEVDVDWHGCYYLREGDGNNLIY